MKAKLEKAKEATRTAKDMTEASKQVSYDLGVQETEVLLVDELAKVYGDYC